MDSRLPERSPGWVRKVNIVLLAGLLALWVRQFSRLLMDIAGRAGYIVDAFCVFLLAVLFAGLIGGAVRGRLTPLRFFLTMAIPLGLVYLILFPPWGAQDTVTHYLASYRVSNLLMMQGEAGAWMGRSEDVMVLERLWPLQPASAPNPKSADYAALLDELYLLTGSKSLMPLTRVPQAAFCSSLNYLPQAAGLTLGRLLGLGSVLTTELGRAAVLAVYLILCARAVRITPVGKSVFALVPLLPPCLMLGTSFSCDGVLLPVALCWLAGLLRLSLGEMRKRNLLFSLVMTFLLGALRGGGYLLLLSPLLFLLLTEAREERGKRAVWLVLVLAAGLCSAALFDLVLSENGLSQLVAEGGGTYSVSLIWKDPARWLHMTLDAYAQGGLRLLAEMGGRRMGWMEKANPQWLAYALLSMALLACLAEKDAARLRKRDIWLLLAAVLLAVLLIPAALLRNTPLTETAVLGLQGRYYLPVLPVLLMLIGKFHLRDPVHGAEGPRDEWETLGTGGRVRVNRATGEVRPVEEKAAGRGEGPQEKGPSGAILQAGYQFFAVLSVYGVWSLMRLYLTR